MVMGRIGSAAISPLSLFFNNQNNKLYARVMAIDGMKYIVENHPECREDVLNQYQHYMAHPNCSDKTFNGLLVSYSIDLVAVELIDDIRTLYQKNCAELSMSGDIEDVEIELGLRQVRDTPRPRYVPEGIDKDLLTSIQDKLFAHKEAPKPPLVYESQKVGRNAPCPCGSGKKYKKCCLH
jgi:hypothetical protein